MFNKVLFVCIGNICRSPMAEGLLKNKLESLHTDIHVSSAGLAALVNRPAAEAAKIILMNRHIDISHHKARQFTEELATDADLILTMETFQKKEIERLYPYLYGKVFILGKWAQFEVPDPYGKSFKDFEMAFELIEKGIDDWLKKLCKL